MKHNKHSADATVAAENDATPAVVGKRSSSHQRYAGVAVQRKKDASSTAAVAQAQESRAAPTDSLAWPDMGSAPVMRKADGAAAEMSDEATQAAAGEGVQGAGQALPHLDQIQESFGSHDLSSIDAHIGGPAAVAGQTIGAQAYATGSSVAFNQAPDLHTAAHEAAHVVQQRDGVQLLGGIGQEGDEYEKNADLVADRVVAGDSAEDLLPGRADAGNQDSSASSTALVQRTASTAQASPSNAVAPPARKPQGAQSKPADRDTSYADAATGLRLIEHATFAAAAFDKAMKKAVFLERSINQVLKTQLNNSTFQDAYRDATEDYAKSKETSSLAEVFAIMGTLVSLATGVGAVVTGIMATAAAIKTAAKLWEGAKEAHKLSTVVENLIPGMEPVAQPDGLIHFLKGAYHTGDKLGHVLKAGHQVYSSGSSIASLGDVRPIDATSNLTHVLAKALLNTNNAVLAGQLNKVAEGISEADSMGRDGRLRINFAGEGLANVTKSEKLLDKATADRLTSMSRAAEQSAAAFRLQMVKVQQMWGAYSAGGAKSLQNTSGERGLFDKVAGWQRAGGSKDLSKQIHIAVDEEQWVVTFDRADYVVDEKEAKFRSPDGPYSAYAYEQRLAKSETGMLICTSTEAYEEVRLWLGNGAGDQTPGVIGEAEAKALLAAQSLQGGRISVSTARALASLGVAQKRAPARVVVSMAGMQKPIEGAASGNAIKDTWPKTPEFAEYWKRTLGGKWRYLYDLDEGKRLDFRHGAAKPDKTVEQVELKEASARRLVGEYCERTFATIDVDISLVKLEVIYANDVRAHVGYVYTGKPGVPVESGWGNRTFDLHFIPMNNSWKVMSHGKEDSAQLY